MSLERVGSRMAGVRPRSVSIHGWARGDVMAILKSHLIDLTLAVVHLIDWC